MIIKNIALCALYYFISILYTLLILLKVKPPKPNQDFQPSQTSLSFTAEVDVNYEFFIIAINENGEAKSNPVVFHIGMPFHLFVCLFVCLFLVITNKSL